MILYAIIFGVSYIGIMLISLMMILGFLYLSGYCVDRVGFTPLATIWVSREHAKRHREVPKDIFVEFICYVIPFIPLLAVNNFFYVFFLNNILLTILMVTAIIIYSLTSLVTFLTFVLRISLNPKDYSERVFVHDKGEREKATYFHDSVTMEESLEIYKEKKIGLFVISYLTYFYNLSTTMIDGWIRIKRKLVSFFRTYGVFMLLIPSMIILSLVVDTSPPEDSEPAEPVEGSYFERNGIIASSVFLLVLMWGSMYLPFIGWMLPEFTFSFELQLNRHNGGCQCFQRIDHYKKTLELIVDSYRSYENALKGG